MNIFRIGLLLIASSTILISCASSKVEQDAEARKIELHSFQESITEDFLKEHLFVFAGDEMEGRGSGMPSIAKAAQYIADFNESIGLEPVGDDGSFFQHFDINATYLDGFTFSAYELSSDTTLLWQTDYTYNTSSDFMLSLGGQNPAQGEVIFTGFGAIDTERGINQLEYENLGGNWVMAFADIPNIVENDTLINPSFNERERLIESIFRKGAAGMILISDQNYDEFSEWAILHSQRFGSPVSLGLPDRPARQGFQSTVLTIRPERAAEILGLGSREELFEKRDQIVDDLSSFETKSTGFFFRSEPMMRQKVIQEKNVAGLLRGGHPELKDEIIVLSAHYDHMGIGAPDEHGDVIYNGADDNGSGSIAIMNIAKAFSDARDAGIRPDRSILFLHVAVEEWGLLGSRYYSDNPIFPIEQTVANINVDMMGRRDREHEEKDDRDFVYIIGAEIISSELDSMLHVGNERSANLRLDMRFNDLTDRNQFYRRSDHWNFGRLRVPFIFFFSGVHPDYHLPGDTPDKILYDSLMKRARVIYSTTVEIANTPQRPRVDNEEFIRITETQAR